MQNSLLLSIQGTYTTTQIALVKAETVVRVANIERERSSAGLIPLINATLKHEKVSINDVEYIAVDQGPGAFISLRVSIVTANAIAFTTDIALVGINSLLALIEQVRKSQHRLIQQTGVTLIVALLNAYGNDVYASYSPADPYTISPSMQPVSIKITSLLKHLTELPHKHKILMTGNGSIMHRTIIEQTPGLTAIFEQTPTEHCSAQTIAELGIKKIKSKNSITSKLSPIYLKNNMTS